MFRNLLGGPLPYVAPWDASLTGRLEELHRGRPRIAWLYEKPVTSTFRYRCFNPPRTIASARPDIGAAWFEMADLPALLIELPGLSTLVICRLRYDAAVARLIARAKAAGVRVVYDCDDLVFDTRYVHLLLDTLDQDTGPTIAWDTWFAMVGRLEATARLCEAGITTNSFLAQHLSSILSGRPVGIVPNYFEREQQDLSRRLLKAKRERGFHGDGRVTIGYFSGTPTHNKDFEVAAPALARLLAADPMVELRIVGFPPPSGPLMPFRERTEVVPLQDYLNLQRVIAEVEVNIAPLQDNIFTNCKSELKFFEAAAVGTWTIATPTFAFRQAIRDGETGRLARAHEWDDALAEAVALARAPARYAPMAEATAEEVNSRYGWDCFTGAILSATGAAFGRRRPLRGLRAALLETVQNVGWSRRSPRRTAGPTLRHGIIPAEGAVDDGGPDFQHQMSAFRRPAHLLLGIHSPMQQPLHRALCDRRRNWFFASAGCRVVDDDVGLSRHISLEMALLQPCWRGAKYARAWGATGPCQTSRGVTLRAKSCPGRFGGTALRRKLPRPRTNDG